MIEAVMLWNEPNNLSHWDFHLDPEWKAYTQMVRLAGAAVRAEAPGLTRVLGGISPIDPFFIGRMRDQGALDEVDVVAVHGFPLDWNHWQIHEWPGKLDEIRTVTHKPIWVSEVGVSSFGAEEVQEFGLRRSAELLIGRSDRISGHRKKLNQVGLATKIEKIRRSPQPRRHVAFRLVLIGCVQAVWPGYGIERISSLDIQRTLVLSIVVGLPHDEPSRF